MSQVYAVDQLVCAREENKIRAHFQCCVICFCFGWCHDSQWHYFWCMIMTWCMHINLYYYIEAFHILSSLKQNTNSKTLYALHIMINGIKANCDACCFVATIPFFSLLSFCLFALHLRFISTLFFFRFRTFFHLIAIFTSNIYFDNVPLLFSRMSFSWTRYVDEKLSEELCYFISVGSFITHSSLSLSLSFFLSSLSFEREIFS